MTVYQFAYNKSNIITRRGEENITLSSSPPVLDCRHYMTGCFSIDAARAHKNFERCVSDGVSIHKARGSLAVGCLQGQHRSRAVAREIAKRLNIAVVML